MRAASSPEPVATLDAASGAAENEIVITRFIGAARELVWTMWTDPGHIAQWWGPNGFTNTVPSIITAVGYGIAFWCMSISIKTVPVGLAYAIWSGVGIVLITAIAWVLFKQRLDAPALAGMGLIVAGVLVINLFSKASA